MKRLSSALEHVKNMQAYFLPEDGVPAWGRGITSATINSPGDPPLRPIPFERVDIDAVVILDEPEEKIARFFPLFNFFASGGALAR